MIAHLRHRIPTICIASSIFAAFSSPALAAIIPNHQQPNNSETNYAGLYFHQFEGTFDGTEWSTWGRLEAENRYEFSDLTNHGTYPAAIQPNGSIVFDNGQGTGSFSSPDEALIDLTLTGGFNFTSNIIRAPFTDERFPVFEQPFHMGNTILTGQWEAVVNDVDPLTGEIIQTNTEIYTITVEDNTIRLANELGEFHQGVWFSDDQAGFRVIGRTTPDPRYRSFEGSKTSLTKDVVGDLRVLDDNRLTFAIFEQTRAPVGRQVQTMHYIELSRVPAPGSTMIIVAGALVLSRRRRS